MSLAGALLISGSATMFTGTLHTDDTYITIKLGPPGGGPGGPGGPPPASRDSGPTGPGSSSPSAPSAAPSVKVSSDTTS